MASDTATTTEQAKATTADGVRKPEAAVDEDIAAAMDAVGADETKAATSAPKPTEEATAAETTEDAAAVKPIVETPPAEDAQETEAAAETVADESSAEEAVDGNSGEGVSESEAEAETDAEVEAETQVAPEASGEESQQDTENEEAPAKPGLVTKLIGGTKKNAKMIGACFGSLLTGAGMMFMLSGSKPEPVIEEVEEAPVYAASLVRRTEPISPIIPFDGLQAEIVLLGERLFHDPGLSRNGKIACASCHDINKGGADGRKLPVGLDNAPGKMNTPSVLTAALNHVQFWDGRAGSLEEQVDSPITNPGEMNSDWPRVLKYLRNNRRYNDAFVSHMGGEPTETLVRTALATYQRALLTVGSPFDQWLQGNENALNSDAYAGYHLFKKMNCINCHNGENVGGHIFQPLGKVKDYFTDSRPATEQDFGRFNITREPDDKFVFRVPSLRNVELTAPYLHDGSVETLSEAVEVMIEYQVGMEANPEDVRRIVLFLESLTAPVPPMPTPPPKVEPEAE